MEETEVLKLMNEYKPAYDRYGSIYCPAIRKNVLFNNSGWKHFRFHGGGKKREKADICYRLSLVPFLANVVKYATVVTDERPVQVRVRGKTKEATFYEISYPVPGHHLTVVIRQIGDGVAHYYSVRNTSKKTKKALRGLL